MKLVSVGCQQNIGLSLLLVSFLMVSGNAVGANSNQTKNSKTLSMNFQDIDVRSVLQILADFSGFNIVAADTVSGNVSLKLTDVPWDQALDLIMKSKGLAKRQEANLILVAPVAEITKIEKDQLESQKVRDALIPLVTEMIQIHYAKASEICGILMGSGNYAVASNSPANATSNHQQSGCGASAGLHSTGVQEAAVSKNESGRLISPRGVVIVDARTNTLIVKDIAVAMQEIHKMIDALDVPVRQVLIETRIVVANTSFARNLGAKFATKTMAKDYEQTDGLAELGYTLNAASAVATGGMSTLVATLASGANHWLDVEIQAMQADGLGEQIANPRIMTTDRVTASISQGVQIPYTTQTANTINTHFKDAVLQLEVTPQITPGGSVIMDLDITRDSQGKNVVTGGQENVAIDKRGIKTKVQVEDGETLVLGGVYESNAIDNYNVLPWVDEIPGLGWLFRSQNKRHDKSELLVFVTPKILNLAVTTN